MRHRLATRGRSKLSCWSGRQWWAQSSALDPDVAFALSLRPATSRPRGSTTDARCERGPATLMDGVHRAAAWVLHHDRDQDYSVVANVVITDHGSWFEPAS